MITVPVTSKSENYLIDLSNQADVFDTIVDATLRKVRLDENLVGRIATQVYIDRRGGDLCELSVNDEFVDALDWQLRGR